MVDLPLGTGTRFLRPSIFRLRGPYCWAWGLSVSSIHLRAAQCRRRHAGARLSNAPSSCHELPVPVWLLGSVGVIEHVDRHVLTFFKAQQGTGKLLRSARWSSCSSPAIPPTIDLENCALIAR
jgi:hypothetical protein